MNVIAENPPAIIECDEQTAVLALVELRQKDEQSAIEIGQELLEWQSRLPRGRFKRAYIAAGWTESDIKSALQKYQRLTENNHSPQVHRMVGDSDNEWYTPAKYIEAARIVMGGIDLDPASCEIAQHAVNAGAFFSKGNDGLKQKWFGRVWLNPPYSGGEIYPFIDKLVSELEIGNVEQAILLTHNSADTAWFHIAEEIASLLCFTRGRIEFNTEEGTNAGKPTQGQTFFYFGDNESEFRIRFSDFGFIR